MPEPCECGVTPALRDGYYVCVNPACDGYEQTCSEAVTDRTPTMRGRAEVKAELEAGTHASQETS